jgi:hypothetical protein
VFTDSILNMDSYLIGVIEVYPKTILEDGIRRELIRLICYFFEKTLVFKVIILYKHFNNCFIFKGGDITEFERNLNKLA